MFVATALLYPCVLAVLCLGVGLLVDRCSGSFLAATLLLPVGAAGLIALSQLTTWAYPLAPATPYAMAALALAGLVICRDRALALLRALRARPLLPIVSVVAYVLALAPVLAAGRPTFSSYMALADSAVHLLGADYLISHGQHYAHLDLRNSSGLFLRNYYDTSYPSGADALFGGSALLLGLPLIWAFQPFNAFMLALAIGPALWLVRRIGLTGLLGGVAALAVVLPAIVYAYELLGSIKEVTTLPLLLALGALVVGHREWLGREPRRAVPAALLVAGGVSALGVAFGAWALAAALVLAATQLRAPARRRAPLARQVGLAALALAIAALPTWVNLRGSVSAAQGIAATSNPGNLQHPLRASQLLGTWLGGSYKLVPHGDLCTATYALIAVALLAVVLGAAALIRARRFALLGWLSLTALTWLLVKTGSSTWAGAKALMLTAPVVALAAWAGVAGLRSLRHGPATALAALALAGGALASDAMQYHSANLAPTRRYDELAALDARFAGRGPVLFTDFDEYSMYQLRDLGVGGPDFVYPPPALAAAAGGYGRPVRLDRIAPAALQRYPLIITRRDPRASRPPAAFRLVWQGDYYRVWARRRHARPALAHLVLAGSPAQRCATISRLAAAAPASARRLVAAPAPPIVAIRVRRGTHPRDWGRSRGALVMSHPGRLRAPFALPAGGRWELWVVGQLMPSVVVAVDGRTVARIAGELSGNSLVPNVAPPLTLRLAAGRHVLSVIRGGFTLAPGEGGPAVLYAAFLTRAGAGGDVRLVSQPPARWRRLCAGRYQWVELTGA